MKSKVEKNTSETKQNTKEENRKESLEKLTFQ